MSIDPGSFSLGYALGYLSGVVTVVLLVSLVAWQTIERLVIPALMRPVEALARSIARAQTDDR